MSPRSDVDQLSAAWRALEGVSDFAGWRTIAVGHGKCYALHAGRRFPDNLEALMVGVEGRRLPPDAQLPKGRGFTVARADIESDAGRSWLALYREPGADQTFFEMMAVDIMEVLREHDSGGADALVSALLARVVAWQEFMKRAGDRVLPPDEEVGLFGELYVLRELLKRIPPHLAVEAWVGPIRGLQDFSFAPGAIEVKTTAASGAFIAKVSNLEQLDDSVIRPLYLAAVRLAQTTGGATLARAVADVQCVVQEHTTAAATFEMRLARAGYVHQSADHYVRRFEWVDVRYLAIDQRTPRLTRDNVPAAVQGARYELDLDAIPSDTSDLTAVLKTLGVC